MSEEFALVQPTSHFPPFTIRYMQPFVFAKDVERTKSTLKMNRVYKPVRVKSCNNKTEVEVLFSVKAIGLNLRMHILFQKLEEGQFKSLIELRNWC